MLSVPLSVHGGQHGAGWGRESVQASRGPVSDSGPYGGFRRGVDLADKREVSSLTAVPKTVPKTPADDGRRPTLRKKK
jgi:hypothetical protein